MALEYIYNPHPTKKKEHWVWIVEKKKKRQMMVLDTNKQTTFL